MPAFELLVLDLRSPLPYEGIENPPVSGLPRSGAILAPAAGGRVREIAVGLGLAEGEEEVFLFDEEALLDFDPDEGPRIRRALPAPGFYGRGAAGGRAPAVGGEAAPSGEAVLRDVSSRELPRGRYAFMQWRPRDESELAEGLEWFAREIWWERSAAEGPYIVRRLREDGALSTQVLRRLAPQPQGNDWGAR
jgi:hypothetical protein